MRIGRHELGYDHPVYVVAEIGINHDGEVAKALRLVEVAADAGCQAVKLQKRTPELHVARETWSQERDTPWGRDSYINYRRRMELDEAGYRAVAAAATARGLDWFASPWDVPSVEFLELLEPPAHKVASACLTDHALLRRLAETRRPVILSTGMSTVMEIKAAARLIPASRLLLCHATSAYPCPAEECNLRAQMNLIVMAGDEGLIGYSGHELGYVPTLAAVALGACYVERHITLDRTARGSDHKASLEPAELAAMVRDIRIVEAALGDGVKRVYDSELGPRAKLRRVA